MKKLLIAAALIGGLYWYKTKDKDDQAPSLTDSQAMSYLAKNQDLQKVFGNDLEKAKEHWLKFGYFEGRTF